MQRNWPAEALSAFGNGLTDIVQNTTATSTTPGQHGNIVGGETPAEETASLESEILRLDDQPHAWTFAVQWAS